MDPVPDVGRYPACCLVALQQASITNKMADSSEEEDNEPFVFYRDREEWKDVTPVTQDDGPHPVVAIVYTEKCKCLCMTVSDKIFQFA